MKSVYAVWRLKKKPFGRRLRSSSLDHALEPKPEIRIGVQRTAYTARSSVRSQRVKRWGWRLVEPGAT